VEEVVVGLPEQAFVAPNHLRGCRRRGRAARDTGVGLDPREVSAACGLSP